ncbi:hypothetical protein WCLP8_3060005 [uncultured Gammaproteobacteria bacterium]
MSATTSTRHNWDGWRGRGGRRGGRRRRRSRRTPEIRECLRTRNKHRCGQRYSQQNQQYFLCFHRTLPDLILDFTYPVRGSADEAQDHARPLGGADLMRIGLTPTSDSRYALRQPYLRERQHRRTRYGNKLIVAKILSFSNATSCALFCG